MWMRDYKWTLCDLPVPPVSKQPTVVFTKLTSSFMSKKEHVEKKCDMTGTETEEIYCPNSGKSVSKKVY